MTQNDSLLAQLNRIEAKLDQLLGQQPQSAEVADATDLDEFERWWQLCPRKVAKKDARKRYWRVIKHELHHVSDPHAYLRERMKAYTRSRTVADGYVVHPSTWLNQGRWDDEPEQQPQWGGMSTSERQQQDRESRRAMIMKWAKAKGKTLSDAEIEARL